MKSKIITLAIIGLFSINSYSADNDDKEPLSTLKEKFSYTMGMRFGGSLIHDGVDLDLESLKLGLDDVFNNKFDRLSSDEMKDVVKVYKEKMMASKQDGGASDENKIEGDKYLAANKDKEGVIVTDAGLQYKVLKKGKGKKPTIDDTVVVNYRATFINGEEFDSSYARNEPTSFPLKGVIKGWTEALLKMQEGDKWQLVIPHYLAYGSKGMQPKIKPYMTLIFEVELLEVKSNNPG